MVLTVQQTITDAMGLIGAIAVDEAPTTSESTLAMRTANVMIDRWSSQHLLLRSTTPITFSMVASTPTYTIGASGATITSGKPLKIQSVVITDAAGLDTALEVIPQSVYDALVDKDVSNGKPTYLAYDPGIAQQAAQKGTISIYPCPDYAYSTKIDSDSYLTEFVNLTDNIVFEPAYYEALIYNLAVRLWRYFHDGGTQIPADIVAIANESLTNLKNLNSVQQLAGMEMPGRMSSYNIYTDN